MSKFAVVDNVNGTFAIRTEHGDAQSALVAFHERCKILWSAPDVIQASVRVVDEYLNLYMNKSELITHSETK